MAWSIVLATATLGGAAWMVFAFIQRQKDRRRLASWQHAEYERLMAQHQIDDAKYEIAEELITADRAAEYAAALSEYRIAEPMWDYYDKAMKEAEAGPVLAWYGDHQVEMEPEVPATPDVPRPPSRQPRLTDYVDMGEVEVVFNRRRSSGQLAVPDLPAESPGPPAALMGKRWYARPVLAACVTLACLLLLWRAVA